MNVHQSDLTGAGWVYDSMIQKIKHSQTVKGPKQQTLGPSLQGLPVTAERLRPQRGKQAAETDQSGKSPLL